MSLTPEQRMLEESAGRYLRDRYSFRHREKAIATPEGYDRARWVEFGQMGWLGLPFPERYGGSGGTMLDVMVLMKAFGRHLVVEPYLSTIVLGGLTIHAAGNENQKDEFIPRIISGDQQIAFGFAEPDSGYNCYDVRTTAVRQNDCFLLNGTKAVVVGAPSADLIIISARSYGQSDDFDGISLFILPRLTPGVSLRSYQTIDGGRAAEVFLDNVPLPSDHALGEIGSAGPILDQALTAARLCVSGFAVGALSGCVQDTVDYLNTREQFGKKLASYQALRHRVADMHVGLREVESLCMLAAESFIRNEFDSNAIVAGAKAYLAEEGRVIAENAVQLHGAIAIADEFIVGHYLKSIIAADRLFGDVEFNLDLFMRAAWDGRPSKPNSD
jgi:alkylation response protein AidB-like acyl-CoA dehydrogenase